jgi:hypothetical protein
LKQTLVSVLTDASLMIPCTFNPFKPVWTQ